MSRQASSTDVAQVMFLPAAQPSLRNPLVWQILTVEILMFRAHVLHAPWCHLAATWNPPVAPVASASKIKKTKKTKTSAVLRSSMFDVPLTMWFSNIRPWPSMMESFRMFFFQDLALQELILWQFCHSQWCEALATELQPRKGSKFDPGHVVYHCWHVRMV